MKYEIHDKEPEFKPFCVTLTFETRDELEQFEAYANTSWATPGAFWREVRGWLGWTDNSACGTYDCTLIKKQ